MLDVGREDLCCAILVVLLLAIIAWKLLWLAARALRPTEGGRPTKHPACLAIGIPRLQRVAIYNRKLVHGAWNATWKRGHFPYARCPVSSVAAARRDRRGLARGARGDPALGIGLGLGIGTGIGLGPALTAAPPPQAILRAAIGLPAQRAAVLASMALEASTP